MNISLLTNIIFTSFSFCRCQCSCREREEHCDPERHYYDSSECRCRCRNPQDRAVCISSGKEWDDRSCSCACPRSTWRQCSTGYTFDYVNTCNCVSTYLIAASGGLTGNNLNYNLSIPI